MTITTLEHGWRINGVLFVIRELLLLNLDFLVIRCRLLHQPTAKLNHLTPTLYKSNKTSPQSKRLRFKPMNHHLIHQQLDWVNSLPMNSTTTFVHQELPTTQYHSSPTLN